MLDRTVFYATSGGQPADKGTLTEIQSVSTLPSDFTGDSHTEWQQTVRAAAAATAGPQFVAKVNDGCSHCPMRSGCPAHNAPRTEQS